MAAGSPDAGCDAIGLSFHGVAGDVRGSNVSHGQQFKVQGGFVFPHIGDEPGDPARSDRFFYRGSVGHGTARGVDQQGLLQQPVKKRLAGQVKGFISAFHVQGYMETDDVGCFQDLIQIDKSSRPFISLPGWVVQ